MKYKNILIIRPDAIGDLVLTLPAVQAVKRAFPDASLTLLLSEYTAPVVKDHPAVDAVIYDYDLKKYNFDLSINFYNQFKDTFAVWRAGIPNRLGDSSRILTAWMNNLRVFRDWTDLNKHEVEQNMALLKPLGIEPDDIPDAGIKIDPQADAVVAKLLPGAGPLIGIHPGTGRGNKPWLPERYAMVADQLDTRVVLLGGKSDLPLAERIMKSQRSGRIINLVGKTDLPQLIALINRLGLFLGVDSGPLHLAAALKRPVVAIFPTKFVRPAEWGPWRTKHVIVRTETSCQKRCRPADCQDDLCVREIEAEDVLKAVAQLRRELR